MNRKYFIWILGIAAVSALFILFSMWRESHAPVPKELIVERPQPPFQTYISAVGIVEASSGNIKIGTAMNRIVSKVDVSVGMRVSKGDVLLRLEDRDLQAELLAKEIALANSIAHVKKLEAMPRSEDLTSAEAALKNAQTDLNMAKRQYEALQGMRDPRSLSKEEVERRSSNYEQALAKMEHAQANLEKVKGGVWKPELEIARLNALQAKADVERIKAEIERTIIRSPIDGKVLQIKTHAGELALGDPRNPMMIIGNTDEMHLRVNINQYDASSFHSTSPAVAFLQGDARVMYQLEYVQTEPVLVAKQDLTNEITEKVDTRVLQVIYAFKNVDHRIYVGDQMDVFIKSQIPQEIEKEKKNAH